MPVPDAIATPYPKPAASPAAHLSRLADELDWLRANVGKVPSVSAQEAGDVRNVVSDLLEWVRVKREAA